MRSSSPWHAFDATQPASALARSTSVTVCRYSMGVRLGHGRGLGSTLAAAENTLTLFWPALCLTTSLRHS